MTSQIFNPSVTFSSNQRDWQHEIGMLPWDTSIVFTKESLIRFLKSIGTEVDTNMSEVKKLPKFASFGKFSSDTSTTSTMPPSASQSSSSVQPASLLSEPVLPQTGFRPTRKVREQPGGGSSQIASLFGGGDENEAPIMDSRRVQPNLAPAAPAAPAALAAPAPAPAPAPVPIQEKQEAEPAPVQHQVFMPDGSVFIPSRKVREPVGGHSSMADVLGF